MTKITKSYSDIPEHDYIVIFFKIYMFDTYDKEFYGIEID